MNKKDKLENTDKKKRTSGKLFLLLALAVILLGTAYAIWKHFEDKKESDSTYEPEIVVEENQELVCGQITKLNGNEITFDIVEEVSLESSSSDSDMSNIDTSDIDTSNIDASEEQVSGNRMGRSGTRPDQVSGNQSVSGNEAGQAMNAGVSENVSGDMPSGEMPSGEMPSGDMPSGEKPSGEMPSGEMASGNMPSGDAAGGAPTSVEGTGTSTVEDSVIYQSTGESKDLQIPVGTKIITELGNEITFSRLAVGDVVKLLMEKDSNGEEVVKIWIVG